MSLYLPENTDKSVPEWKHAEIIAPPSHRFCLSLHPTWTSPADFFILLPGWCRAQRSVLRASLSFTHQCISPIYSQPFFLLFLFFLLASQPACPPVFRVSQAGAVMQPLCLYSLSTSGVHEIELLIWLNPELWELQQWTEGIEGHRQEYIIYRQRERWIDGRPALTHLHPIAH